MGFFKMKCADCDETFEVFQRWVVDKETRETVHNFEIEDVYCGHEECFYEDYQRIDDKFIGCGSPNTFRVLQGASFGISSKGLNGDHQGYYSPDLGKHFNNQFEACEYAEANGFKRLSQVNIDDVMQRRVDLDAQDSADLKAISSMEAAGVDKAEAYGKVFSTKELKKRGLLDNSIKGDD
jgi:hypothetical protein